MISLSQSERAAAYNEFVARKIISAPTLGFDVDPSILNPELKPFTRDIVRWALRGGRRAIFAAFGLHKTATQLEIMRLLADKTSGLRLIVMPLEVRHEFKRECKERFRFGFELPMKTKFIRTISEVEDERTIYLTNYESVREGILDVSQVEAISLDEAAVLAARGSKTFGEFTFNLFRETRFRFMATATPDPNEYQELLSYAAFLDICDISQARTRFFKRNSEHADKLTLHEHKEAEFWLWVSTWAVCLSRPSDLGYSDEGYELPDLDIHWHELPSDHSRAGEEKKSGQLRLVKNAAAGVQDAAGARKFWGIDLEPFLVVLRNHGDARSIDDPIPALTANGQHFGICEPLILGQQSGAKGRPVSKPCPTIATGGAIALIEPFIVPFMSERDGQRPRTHSVDAPLPTVTCSNSKGLVEPFLVTVNHGDSGGSRTRSLGEPFPTATSKIGHGIVEPFIVPQFGEAPARSVDRPLGTVTTTSRGIGLIEPFLVKYTRTGKAHSVEEPIDTVTTRDRFGLVELGDGRYLDIRFRMLQPHELSRAMSFPDDYKFAGNREAKVKQIGNAVPVNLAKALCMEALA